MVIKFVLKKLELLAKNTHMVSYANQLKISFTKITQYTWSQEIQQ